MITLKVFNLQKQKMDFLSTPNSTKKLDRWTPYKSSAVSIQSPTVRHSKLCELYILLCKSQFNQRIQRTFKSFNNNKNDNYMDKNSKEILTEYPSSMDRNRNHRKKSDWKVSWNVVHETNSQIDYKLLNNLPT